MAKIKLKHLSMMLLSCIFILLQTACSKKIDEKKLFNVDPAFSSYISAYTTGNVSVESKIRIQFTKNVNDSVSYGASADNLFSFSPSIKGKSYWVDARTIEFSPDEKLPYGTTYKANFDLEALMGVKEDKLKNFEFAFKTLNLFFEFEVYGISYINDEQTVKGAVHFSDVATVEQVKNILEAEQNSNELKVEWTASEDNKVFYFTVLDVKRGNQVSEVLLTYSGSSLDLDISGEEKVEVPAKGDFSFISSKVIQNPDQYIMLRFSDLLDPNQNLNGLISASNLDFNFEINGNELKVYPETRQAGAKTIYINSGIRSIDGKVISQGVSFTAEFQQEKPNVRWVNSGHILPTTQGVLLPFEAVSLKSVNVEILKVYEENVAQFFQVNQIEGSRELRRVARPILRKVVSLEESGVVNLNKWNHFTLNLADLINAEPGAIYNVKITFNKNQSLYACANDTDDASTTSFGNDDYDSFEDDSYWDDYEYYYYGNGYSYRERDNPCHVSYYMYNKGINRNILASDLGLIAKRGKDNKLNITVTNIQDAQPLSGVEVKALNYQQIEIAKGTTDADGLVNLNPKVKPYLIVASHNKQKGYLRVDNASSLSLSHFNTSGLESNAGVKGFIYGERGVWRPGDSLYLNFILEDKGKSLPLDIPVVMELKDPLGRIFTSIVKNKSIDGLYDFRTATNTESPTGNWTAIVKVGNNEFSKTLPIETIKPNRLKININFSEKELSSNTGNVQGTLGVKWLHGADASNLKAKVEAVLAPTPTHFDKFSNYIFDDYSRKFSSESKVIYEDVIDENGEATFNATFDVENQPPGKLTAKLKTEVFENSGNSSVDRFQIPYHPYDSYVGLMTPKGDASKGMLLTDTTHDINIVSVNTKGELVSGTKNVTVKLQKLRWRWWWDKTSNNSNYINDFYGKTIVSGNTTLTNGKGVFKLKINRPEWGRYYLSVTDPVSGHKAGKIVYIDWPGWAGKPANEASSVSILTFDSDKPSYQVGETAKINIPSSPDGNALVSIENGRGVLKQFWVKTQKGNTTFELDILKDYTPNAYIHVSQLQAHNHNQNDLPLRMYGIININVENEKTHLKPEIDLPDVLEPEQKFSVQVSEATGQEMAYTLAIVDEGLLDLTRFKTPDSWSHFYAKEALGVKTYDVYDEIIGAYNNEFERVLGLGGGLDGKTQESSKLNRFKPVVKVLGPFKLEAGKKVSHQIKMPYYVGSVRVMLVANNKNYAYGKTEKAVPVRKPLMVLATLPRVLGPNEDVLLPVSAFAMEEGVKTAEISIEHNDLFENKGKRSYKVTFPKVGEQMAYFKLRTSNKTGIAKVTVYGKSGKNESKDVIELEVRNPNPMATNVEEGVLEANAKMSFELSKMGTQGTNSAMLEVSSIPALNLEKRLKYLIRYPHGCIEQITSAVFPQLFLAELTELTPLQQQEIDKNIQAYINRISSFQTNEGGFSYWPGQLAPSEWGSNYAGHFLVEAKNKGYNVPDKMLKNWRKFQQKYANMYRANNSSNPNYHHNNGLDQAYRLYTLALMQKPELGAMNRLKQENNLSPIAQWRLAACYALAGQKEVANSIISNLNLTVAEYKELSYTYGSSERDLAMLLESLHILGRTNDVFKVLDQLAKKVGSKQWMSTQTTGYALLAIGKVVKNLQKDPINFTYSIGNESERQVSTTLPIAQIKITEEQLSKGSITIKSKAASVFYIRLITQGKPAAGDSTETNNDLEMTYTYKDLLGNPINPSQLTQGTSFMVEVSIKNPGIRGNYKEMALNQTFPSGWEITNTRMDGTESFYNASTPTYQDIRDDKVYTYFDLNANETKTFRILLNASYAGKFYLPSVVCEAMYDASISARKKGMWIEVINKNIN